MSCCEMVISKGILNQRKLSIGPIHALILNLFRREHKVKLVAYFIKRRDHTADDLLTDIMTKIKEIKTHFDEEVIKPYTDEQLIWSLFLDGCAMLEFIDSNVIHRICFC